MNNRYQVNNFIFDTASRLLLIEKSSKELDPKVADLLTYFLKHPNRVLTREEILDNVWEGRVVTDNTLTWSISQLRKAFEDNASEPSFIKTVPKKGYQFIADATLLDSSEPAINRSKFFRPAFVSSLLIIAIVSYFSFELLVSEQYEVGSIQQVTVLDGIEEDGDLSSDQKYLLFKHKPVNSPQYKLMLKPMLDTQLVSAADKNNSLVVGNRDQMPIDIGKPHLDHKAIIWGLTDYQIIAARASDNDCKIVSITLAANRTESQSESILTECNKGAAISLDLDSESQTLFFTDIEHNKSHVYQLRLGTNERSKLFTSEQPGLGVRFLSLNLNASSLLLLEDVERSKTRFIKLDLKSNQSKIIYETDSVYSRAHFAPDGEDLWLNMGNDVLTQLDVKDQQLTTLMQTSFGWNYNLKPVTPDLATMSVSNGNSKDIGVWIGGSEKQRTPTFFNESQPTLSPDGRQIAYISDQTGLSQIWIDDLTSGNQKQISTLRNYREFQALEFSPDGRWLLGASKEELAVIDLATGKFRQLHLAEHTIMYPTWDSKSETILFSKNTPDGWKIYSVSVHETHENIEPVIDNGWLARFWNNGILYSKPHQSGLFFRSQETTQQIFKQIPANSYWRMIDSHIVYIEQGDQTELFRLKDELAQPELILQHNGFLSQKFSMQGNVIVAEQINFFQSDIKFVHRKIN